MKLLLSIFCFFILCNCISDSYVLNAKVSSDNQTITNRFFKATLNGKSYEVLVNCTFIQADSFQFKSDNTDIFDSNGDGLVISGMQNKDTLTLTIIDEDYAYSTFNATNFKNNVEHLSASGTMILEGIDQQFDIVLELEHINYKKIVL